MPDSPVHLPALAPPEKSQPGLLQPGIFQGECSAIEPEPQDAFLWIDAIPPEKIHTLINFGWVRVRLTKPSAVVASGLHFPKFC